MQGGHGKDTQTMKPPRIALCPDHGLPVNWAVSETGTAGTASCGCAVLVSRTGSGLTARSVELCGRPGEQRPRDAYLPARLGEPRSGKLPWIPVIALDCERHS
jgi:hypothetical protein